MCAHSSNHNRNGIILNFNRFVIHVLHDLCTDKFKNIIYLLLFLYLLDILLNDK
jgi:hypothetical protein